MITVKARVKPHRDDDAPVIPVVIPELDEVRAFAAKIHAKGKAWPGEAFGWQAEYNPEKPKPPLDSNELAEQLTKSARISAVKAQLDLLRAVQEEVYWETVSLARLEELRCNLRDLPRFIDREKQDLIYTDFKDELGEIREVDVPYLSGGVNVAQYRKKVEQFIRAHEDYVVIQKIKWAIPLEPDDLRQLEEFFFTAGETGSREAFEQAYGQGENLGEFVRRLVGLDRKAAKEKFAAYLDGKTCTADQIRFVNFIIDHLAQNGAIDPDLLYDRPFTDIHEQGLEGVFPDQQADELVEIIIAINRSVYPVAV